MSKQRKIVSKEKLRRKFLKEEEVRRDPGGKKKGDREEKQYDSKNEGWKKALPLI